MPPRNARVRYALLAVLAALPADALAQSSSNLPTINVEENRQRPARPSRGAPANAAPTSEPAAPSVEPQGDGTQTPAGGSLTIPGIDQARAIINRTPGGVEIVPDTQFKDGPARTIKDVLDWVSGVIVQPRWGPDARISIRGSGLSRNYGNRGLNLFMDGIPINTSDGLFDLFEIDPTAYRYVEVFKGANALRFGSNSLGGAINFVMPSGRDASALDSRIDVGSFGFVRGQASTGGVNGPYDWFINASAQREDGYREHNKSDMERVNANFGYQFSPNAETRFYVNANSWRAQLPGEVTKDWALNTPRKPNPAFVLQDQQRNIDSIRLANKTTLRFDSTTVDVGVYTHQRHVDHPIYRYIDYDVADYGGFVRATDDRMIGGFRNRLVAGVNALGGNIDYREYVNLGNAVKGPLATSQTWKSENYSAYAENSFYILPNVALVAGTQFLYAVRDQKDRFFADTTVNPFDTQPNDSGRRTYNLWTPKVGLLWDVDRTWQVFANVSDSAEVPTFDANTFSAPLSSNLKAQTATTYEVGTRGRRPDFTWDLSIYRALVRNELQCLTTSPFSPCTVVNADRTVHQGVEAGLGLAFLKSIFVQEDRFWLNVAYTYSDFFFDNDPVWGNNRLPGVPPNYLRAEVLYKNPNGFFAGPNVEWMPRAFFADNANSLTVDPYALLNFRVGYDPGKGWSGYVEGRNLLDTRYISTTITAGVANPTMELFNPGVGRAVYAGLRYRM
jgi:iron complex outermembrane receptor protein